MTTERRARASRPLLALWLANVAAILALTLTGGPLRSGLLQYAPDSTTPLGWVALAALALAFVTWAFRNHRQVPPLRLAIACVAVAAMLAWAWTIHLPSERMHLLLFGTLGITTSSALGLRAGLCFALAWAGIDELVQLQLPDRVADWTDVGLNAASAMAGWLVVFAHRGAGPGVPDRAEP
jgi:ABC-type Fe3+-siderophore transport system permease subunit